MERVYLISNGYIKDCGVIAAVWAVSPCSHPLACCYVLSWVTMG